MTAAPIARSATIFAAGLAGSVAVGLAAAGTRIFDPHLAAFQFVVSGAVAAALAAAFASDRARLVAGVAGAACAVLLALGRPDTPALLLRDLLWVPTLAASVWLARRLERAVGWPPAGRFVYWGVAFAACHLAAFGLLSLANGVPLARGPAFAVVRIGGLIGAGVGFGGEIAAWLTRRPEPVPEPERVP